jgi:hypothetical protein
MVSFEVTGKRKGDQCDQADVNAPTVFRQPQLWIPTRAALSSRIRLSRNACSRRKGLGTAYFSYIVYNSFRSP